MLISGTSKQIINIQTCLPQFSHNHVSIFNAPILCPQTQHCKEAEFQEGINSSSFSHEVEVNPELTVSQHLLTLPGTVHPFPFYSHFLLIHWEWAVGTELSPQEEKALVKKWQWWYHAVDLGQSNETLQAGPSLPGGSVFTWPKWTQKNQMIGVVRCVGQDILIDQVPGISMLRYKESNSS